MQISPIQFQRAGIMPYASQSHIQDKAYILTQQLKSYVKSIPQEENLSFKPGELVYIPDLHGDFAHMIITLYRHGLLDKDLNLNPDHTYVFLGDFYNRGEDSDVIDHWVNNQIQTGIEIFRLAGNHEVFFVARDKDGKSKPLRKPIKGLIIPSNDVDNDIKNGFQVTEDILKSIRDGNLIAAYLTQNKKDDLAMSYTHSFLTDIDFELLDVPKDDMGNFVIKLNTHFQELGRDSYERFMDSKTKGKYNWDEIKEPFYAVSKKYKGVSASSFLMRVTGVIETDGPRRVKPSLEDHKIPGGVYQTVGHTIIPHFVLPIGHPTDRPFVLQDKEKKGSVQFSDVGIGLHYKKDDFTRPEVVINPKEAMLINQE